MKTNLKSKKKVAKKATGKVITKRSTKTAVKTLRRSSSVVSLENGIKILKLAIRRKISLSAAAKDSGRGKNYISDIKARLEENYKSKNISKELYTSFKSLNKDYEKLSK